jgi:hypothetical protein
MRQLPLVLCLLVLSACSPRIGPSPNSLQSGIEIQVLIGPMCPVVQAGTECPDQPYQAELTLLDPNGREILQFETDAQGSYATSLEPGRYILRPESPPGSPLPSAEEQQFVVESGEITRLLVRYDSGIR